MLMQNVLYQEGSPGQVFMLDENALVDALQKLNSTRSFGGNFYFVESAGIAQVYCDLELSESTELLNSYYSRGYE